MKLPGALLVLSFLPVVHASTIGAIEVCYFCVAGPGVSDFGFGVQDAPIFHFTNVTANDITSASFTIFASGDNLTQDTFQIGTIAAGSFFDLWVGVTSDGGTGHTFFNPIGGGGLDTSDLAPDSDAVQFQFQATWNDQPLTSGVFAAGDTAGPSLDGTVAHLNFLGGPNGADGPCGSCFFGTVATFPPAAPTPEPGGLALLGAGLAGLAIYTCAFRRRPL
jgi:hypothetical protein